MGIALLQLGDYQLIEQVGEDLLGKRYIAEHRFLKKHFLLTLLPEAISEAGDFFEHFSREVAHLATLEHPNLLPLFHASEAEGRYFLVSELPKGRPLADQREYSEEQILKIARQLSDLIEYLHSQQVILGTAISLNSLYVQGETLFAADVGLSRFIAQSALLTDTYREIWERMIHKMAGEELRDALLGYAAFLPPESAITLKSDYYSFGVLLYYLLMGHYPIGTFELPSARHSGNWDALILCCLQSDPDKRPAQLKALLGPTSKNRPLLKPQQLVRPEHDPDPAAAFQVDPVVATYAPEKSTEQSSEPLLTEMAIVPAGNYIRGSTQGARDEMPRHQIYLSSYAIDIHPVTNEQFVRFLEAMGGEKDANHNDIIRLRDSRIKRFGGKLSIESGYAKHPVVGVTWYGAAAYAGWVGKRLPTEAEWEIAACGGRESLHYPTGDSIERTQANFFSSDTTAVMSYPANGYGLYDMAGNVYEWCQDWYGYNYYETSVQEPNNPKGPLQGVYRVMRGGCWKSLKEDMRCAHRHRNNPGSMNGTYGFRCVADMA